jgi:TetR/AcrR family transcriptional repressor of nem operon
MPRASREQARMNRLAVEEASSRLFRERGIQAVSVADLMGAVGLTPGGFYGHFASKDELAAIACNVAFDDAARRWRKRMQGKRNKREAFNAIVDGYLTRRNRDDPADACPSATLASDVARELPDKPVCGAYLGGIKGQLKTLASLRDSEASGTAQREAMIQLALLVGSMALARASRGDQISDEFLDVGKDFLRAFGEYTAKQSEEPASTPSR